MFSQPMACHSRKSVGVEIADVLILEAYASFREMALQACRVRGSKDEHFITQKDNQPSQTCVLEDSSNIQTLSFFAIGEYNPI
jgi:tRNA/tmRNA/rRNA uracil-C5-methylase (TrmA/RlmC/RlmD family)